MTSRSHSNMDMEGPGKRTTRAEQKAEIQREAALRIESLMGTAWSEEKIAHRLQDEFNLIVEMKSFLAQRKSASYPRRPLYLQEQECRSTVPILMSWKHFGQHTKHS
ncbi:hypothetical protein PRIPAC_97474 [Pristionchus pacificus]|uniref:Uncharacterized protein n=1 Tax=Pristionchus pacificus TaxID=54126 RepID=A0A454Y2F0_PRIPA|nr:hypothetical protein PRIPAC_97474 [Pristionchus pacificus]|eukprot:PDM84213.1 hypothetical protein PRIPAC_33236 [Pristionchus pacificus]